VGSKKCATKSTNKKTWGVNTYIVLILYTLIAIILSGIIFY